MNLYKYLKKQVNMAAITLMLFTRFPLPSKLVRFDSGSLGNIHHFIPLAGLLAAILQAIVYFAVHLYYSHMVAVVVTVASGLLITGAFHEDGFADVCDSLGGNTVHDKLAIMKDSRLGTYGVAGLFMVLASRILFLNEINETAMVPVLTAAGLLSRWSLLVPLNLLPYIGRTESFRPLYEGLNALKFLVITALVLLLAWWLLDGISGVWPVYTAASVLGGYYFFKKHLGGVTGDAMGAMVVVTELAVLFSAIAGRY